MATSDRFFYHITKYIENYLFQRDIKDFESKKPLHGVIRIFAHAHPHAGSIKKFVIVMEISNIM